MNTETGHQLIEYGRSLMARVAAGEKRSDPPWVSGYWEWLGVAPAATGVAEPLQAILTLVAGQVTPAYLRPVPLQLPPRDGPADWTLMPVARAAAAGDRTALYAEFLAHGGGTETDFLRFFHLMRKYASTLPNTLGEPGVSLFEQWKLIAALVAASGDTSHPPQRVGLVSGDIPGIQRTINLVTSKGAAKAMRGRSAFIQLLGHALVERLLAELNLCPANVVYDAGGNFVLLTGWADDTAARVAKVANQVNRVLLGGEGIERFDGFHGDLAVALAAVEIRPLPDRLPIQAPAEALRPNPPELVLPDGTRGSAWQLAEKLVKDAVAAAKERPFGDLALADAEGWEALFAPEATETDDFCAVCRRQRGAKERWRRLGDDSEDLICPECQGFNDLARDLGRGGARLLLLRQEPQQTAAWQRALWAVSGGWWYEIGRAGGRGDITLALDLDDFPAADVDGLRLLARTTPMEGDAIKDNEKIVADGGGSFKRLGVLRMDVDDLGHLLVYGLPRRSLTQTAELSQALERFFVGWLDRICRRIDGGKDLFYVLFAGGDDLLAVGPWQYMPELARAIRKDFVRYTAGHGGIHLSAGIAVVGEKAPLYAAADEAHDALEAAKALDRDHPDRTRAKNGITFLGYSYHWEEFDEVYGLKTTLTSSPLVGLRMSLLTRLQAIERRWRQDWQHDAELARNPARVADRRRRGQWADRLDSSGRKVRVYYGPWMWRQAYALTRLAEGQSEEVRKGLERLRNALLDGKIAYLGLAARWAQWEIRKEQ